MASDKAKILAGRQAVDAYRAAHTALHKKPRHKGVPEEHTPLLNKMLAALKKQDFNSLDEFFEANRKYCVGIENPTKVWKNREDLELVFPVDKGGIKIEVSPHKGETYASLYMDGRHWMNTSEDSHTDMYGVVQKCPNNAGVLTGGLGLGLILLYLAASGKTSKVIVVEIDERLVSILTPPYKDWFALNYPDFKFDVVVGDIGKEVAELGRFDWIFLDTDTPWTEDQFSPYLNAGGRITIWKPPILEWE